MKMHQTDDTKKAIHRRMFTQKLSGQFNKY